MIELLQRIETISNPKIDFGKIDSFLRCLGNNCSRSSYYKYIIWGNEGRKALLDKYYLSILKNVIKKFREDVLLIVIEDSDNRDLTNLIDRWCENTKRTLTNKKTFQTLFPFNRTSDKTIEINIRSNNIVNIYYNIVPQSLEYQVANANMARNNLEIDETIQQDYHRFLKKVANLLGSDVEYLIKSSVNLLKDEVWVKKLVNLIEVFELN